MTADFVVIGAGSAGCVVARRLADSGASVLLIEAGPRDRHPMIHVPAGMVKLLDHPRLNWNYVTEPDAAVANRAIPWPRGRVLGGTSAINGMAYVRGNPADFDHWVQLGCHGWSYREVLPYFKRSESYRGGDDAYRGRDGPLAVEDYRTILPITHRFVEAAAQAGFARTTDINGDCQEGVGYSQMTRRGRWRASTARAFLGGPHPHLDIVTGALATRLLFEGRRCTGVAFWHDGAIRRARAARGVILSGGAINSPQLLQLSGIGPAAHLRAIGIEPVLDLPGVGANLADHYAARVSHRVTGTRTANELRHGIRLAGEVVRWLFSGDGALTFGVTTAMVFCRSRPDLASPDLQLLFTPISFDQDRFGALETLPGMSISVCATRPESRGTVMAESPDPRQKPIIHANYLNVAADLDAIVAGMRVARRIFAAPALASHSAGETLPGPACDGNVALAAFTRAQGGTVYHPVGTCKMGTDPMAVVDPRLRVHGCAGLHVIDASVMPTLTTGNTNAPTIMIGEKGADMVIEDARAGAAA
ncbi:MAG: GMC family oxidoreductase [Stellaceae bacterium]